MFVLDKTDKDTVENDCGRRGVLLITQTILQIVPLWCYPLERNGERVSRKAHNLETDGSNPSSAIIRSTNAFRITLGFSGFSDQVFSLLHDVANGAGKNHFANTINSIAL